MSVRVTLKLATSLDGRIALASGESKWITGEEAREEGHRMRARHDAILVGIGTALQDDPELTVRLKGHDDQPQPLRVVLDTRLRLPPDSKLAATTGKGPVLVFCQPGADAEKRAQLEAAGVTVAEAILGDDGLDPGAVLSALAGAGVETLMIEGGGRVAGSFLYAEKVDAIAWFRAPILIGDDGAPGVGALHLEALRHAPKFTRTGLRAIGPDVLETYERA
jgi:diaminohydroxyphosphoribosylaminopyrimidine deaminase / 5-amino-6-(5-phosphoribosylamino)uracil reductase